MRKRSVNDHKCKAYCRQFEMIRPRLHCATYCVLPFCGKIKSFERIYMFDLFFFVYGNACSERAYVFVCARVSPECLRTITLRSIICICSNVHYELVNERIEKGRETERKSGDNNETDNSSSIGNWQFVYFN